MAATKVNIFGLLTDITRSLTALIIHIDNLLLLITPGSDTYDEICQANEQIWQSIIYLMELRELHLYHKDLIDKTLNNADKE